MTFTRSDRNFYTYDGAPNEQRFSKHPHGVPMHHGMFWHPMPDGSRRMSYNGIAFYEVFPDGSAYILFHDDYSSGTTNRLNYIMQGLISHEHKITVGTRKKRRANGLHEWTLNIYSRPENTSVTCRHRLQVLNANGEIDIKPADIEIAAVVKDNKRYRAASAEIKKLKALLIAQAKMGGWDKYAFETSWSYPRTLDPRFKELFESGATKGDLNNGYWSIGYHCDAELYPTFVDWIEGRKQSGTAAEKMMFGLLRDARSEAKYDNGHELDRRREDIKRRIINGLRRLQVKYLQQKCVTISESNILLRPSNGAPENEDGQLLPTAGLREVQVPGEAEVC